MPRAVIYAGILLGALLLLPIGWLALSMSSDSGSGRIQVIPNMDNQPRNRTQSTSEFFADGRASRLPVEGVVAREDVAVVDARSTGRQGEAFVEEIPGGIDRAMLDRGQERFGIYCAPCHGLAGRGDGPVARRAAELAESTWVAPSNLSAATVMARPDGELFSIITSGIRNMPSYAAQIPLDDRWAVVAYVRALQRSANATIEDVPADQRSALE